MKILLPTHFYLYRDLRQFSSSGFHCGSSPLCSVDPRDPSGATSLVNTTPTTTGKPMFTTGRRVMEFSILYSF
ncbi:MAG: hypothetical protein ABSB82_19750 [Terriglobia bacterium]